MEQMYLSFLLTSFIIGMLILILLEKKKTQSKEEKVQPTTFTNTTDAKPEITQDIKSTTELHITKALIEEKVTEKHNEDDVKSVIRTPSTSSSSSSSSGEEEVVKVRVPRKPKKHACKGSVVTCATKRKVTAVTIVTDSEEEEVKVSLDDLAGEIRTQGVTCDVHPAFTHLNPISNEPSHLLLLFGTTSKGCERLRDSLRLALGGAAALPTPQPFLYSVSCWSTAAAGEVFESAVELSASLGLCGGAEWLPVTCITTTTTTEGEDTTQPPVMAREQYMKTVMDKITKPGKKCCGTSCGSKTVDIEDLASSLLLPRAAVTS